MTRLTSELKEATERVSALTTELTQTTFELNEVQTIRDVYV